MLDLRELKLYEQSLPELQEALTAAATKARATEDTTFDLLFCFGFAQDPRFEAFGRLLFDWYRCPAMKSRSLPANDGKSNGCAPAHWPGSERKKRNSSAQVCTGTPSATGAIRAAVRSPAIR